MRSTVPLRRLLGTTAAIAGAVLLVAGIAPVTPVAAKEDLVARLDAPIAFGTPPGTEIQVGVTVEFPAEDGLHPVDGSPIHLLLTGRDGSVTRAAGAADGKPGHYTMRAVIPTGGVRGAQVVMHGTSDLALRLAADPFTFGSVRAGTAQVAPPLAPPITPWPRGAAADGDPAPAADGADGGEAAAPPEAAVPGAPAVEAQVSDAGLVVPVAVAVGTLALIGLAAAVIGWARSTRAGTAGRQPGA